MFGDDVGGLHPAVTHEVVDAHPHRRLEQPLLSVDEPEPLVVVQVTDRHRQRIDMPGRDVATRQGTFEQHEQVAGLGPQPAHPALRADNP